MYLFSPLAMSFFLPLCCSLGRSLGRSLFRSVCVGSFVVLESSLVLYVVRSVVSSV